MTAQIHTQDPALVPYASEQRIGIYDTPDAARRAKAIMIERGIPPSQVSVLASENPDGIQLATRRINRAPSSGWFGLACGSMVGALLGATLGRGSLALLGLGVLGGRWVSALVLAFVLGLVGAAMGAIAGARRAAYRTAFQQGDASRFGSAVGVVTTTPEQSRMASYALKSTGAIDIHRERARVRPRVV